MDDVEILNVPVVLQTVRAKGIKRRWLIDQLGLKATAGYVMLRNGVLPADKTSRKEVVTKLAKMLGLSVPQILIRLTGAEPKSA